MSRLQSQVTCLVLCAIVALASLTGAAADDTKTEEKQFSLSSSRGSRESLEFIVTVPGLIEIEAEWSASATQPGKKASLVSLALMLNGPGQTSYYARNDGTSPLRVQYQVTQADVDKGNTWKAAAVNFSRKGPVAGKIKATYPIPATTVATGPIQPPEAQPSTGTQPGAAVQPKTGVKIQPVKKPPKVTIRPRQPLLTGAYVRAVMDSLYCQNESKWDHGTDSDEPYVMATGYATHRDPNAWSAGPPQDFDDVDSGENRRITKSQRVIFAGPVPPDAVAGFHAIVWEEDTCPKNTRTDVGERMAEKVGGAVRVWSEGGEAALGYPGKLAGAIIGATGAIWASIFTEIACFIGGGGDDKIADAAVAFSHDQLRDWLLQAPAHKAMEMDLDGGSEGHYRLRYHLELVPNATQEFDARFTNYDDFALGDLDGGPELEIVIAIDEDASGNNGRFYIYDAAGRTIRSFDAFYTKYDRVLVGDVMSDARPEVVVASDDHGGMVNIYTNSGHQLYSFAAPYTKYDGLAVANVTGGDKAEILIAKDDNNKIYIYSDRGVKLGEFGLNWNFEGVRNLGENTRHDAFLVGDVRGDGKAEIVMLENKNGSNSLIRVYNCAGSELISPVRLGTLGGVFTKYDATALGNLDGDDKKELLVAIDGGDGRNGHQVRVYDLNAKRLVNTRHWPCFTKYDGFAAGNVLGKGKDQIVLATDEDDRVYISQ